MCISSVGFARRFGSKNRASMRGCCRIDSTRASGYTIWRSVSRSGKPSSMSHERPEPRGPLAPDLAHGALSGLSGEGEARRRLYARRLPQHFVDRRYGVFRADGVLYGDVEVGEEARVDLAVRCEPEPAATGAEGFRDRRYDAEGTRGATEAELVRGRCRVFLLDRFQVPQLLR